MWVLHLCTIPNLPLKLLPPTPTPMKPLRLIGLLSFLICSAPAAEPFLEKQDLFLAGEDPAYSLYHIPGIVVTAKGTVLAWCEARHGGGDWSDIRILLRRSTDDGKSWSPPRNIAEVEGPKRKNPVAPKPKNLDEAGVTYNNPVLIADKDGTVHMLFCLEYERAFYQRSEDDGVSWSKPVEITAIFESFRSHMDWKVLATGPNHGIQLQNGRLLVPIWLSTSGSHRPSVTATIFSDDHGKTWKAGDVAVPCTEEWINPNETVAIELQDGRVMLNVRNESKAHRRLLTTSPNGSSDWTTPKFDQALLEPICMAGLARYEHAGKSLLLFSNPHTLDGRREGEPKPGEARARKNLSMKISRDEGQTWPVNKLIESGPSMYSDIAVTRRGTILCFYGRGKTPGTVATGYIGSGLTLARFKLEWLEQP